MRILGLDVGSKRIGVAVSDELGWTAQPLMVINCDGKQISRLQEIIEEYGVSSIVIGNPLMMSGQAGIQTEKMLAFKELLAKAVGLPIVEWDERLTTSAAERMLIDADISRGKRKKVIDKLASVLILQNYLDYLTFQKNKSGSD